MDTVQIRVNIPTLSKIPGEIADADPVTAAGLVSAGFAEYVTPPVDAPPADPEPKKRGGRPPKPVAAVVVTDTAPAVVDPPVAVVTDTGPADAEPTDVPPPFVDGWDPDADPTPND